jgi:hypothetical protein
MTNADNIAPHLCHLPTGERDRMRGPDSDFKGAKYGKLEYD